MEKCSIIVLLIIALMLLLSDCNVLDTISANQTIKDGETMVSEGGVFEMGFFSPGKNTKKRYVGIWYKKISTCTVIWVANREIPVTDKSGIFKVSKHGNLLILNGGNSTVWSSKTMVLTSNNPVVAVQLLDTGNLVVWDQSSTNKNMVWQSFDYPSDTLPPGLKMGKDLVTGLERYAASWKSPNDPSIGMYNCTKSR